MWKTIIKPRFSDTDGLQHISNIAIVDMMEASRNELFRIFTPDLDLKKWRLILARVATDYLRQLYFQDDIEIRSGIKKIGNTSFILEQTAYQYHKKCAITEAVLVHFDFQQQKKQPISDAILKELQKHIIN